MTLTLQEAIAFVRDAKPGPGVGQKWDAINFKFGVEPVQIDHAIASIMNAIASGDLITKDDAEQAVAVAYQRAADEVLEHKHFAKGIDCAAECILALAPADALAEVQCLRGAARSAVHDIADYLIDDTGTYPLEAALASLRAALGDAG